MKKIKLVFFVSIIALATTSNAQKKRASEAQFDLINDYFESFFIANAPSNVKIKINANWEINYPAASTDRSTDFEITRLETPVRWNVSILGGYMQDVDGGVDVHLFALCHEMAHHLGGTPYKTDEDGKIRWASMEAQSDYWAAKVCMPKFLKTHPNFLVNRRNIHPEIKRQCAREFYTWFSNYKICLFTSQAAYQLAKIHDKNRLPSEPILPDVNPEIPDPSIVNVLDRNIYPTNQCRFDTAFAGALNRPRPRCWYP